MRALFLIKQSGLEAVDDGFWRGEERAFSTGGNGGNGGEEARRDNGAVVSANGLSRQAALRAAGKEKAEQSLKEIGAPAKRDQMPDRQVHAPDNDLKPGIWTRAQCSASQQVSQERRCAIETYSQPEVNNFRPTLRTGRANSGFEYGGIEIV